MPNETIFAMDTSSIKFGPGATLEVGFDMQRLGARRVMVLTDRNLVDEEPVTITLDALRAERIDAVLYDGVRCEPSDTSFKEAIRFATQGRFDGYVAVGGGSVMDTAKAANLYATHPADFFFYVNPPIGQGQPVPGPLRPLIAIPTTAGTGSETTGVSIFDLEEMHTKTGIAHRLMRPALGIVDPNNTRTLPPMVAASTGFDVLCHAAESLTLLPFDQRPATAARGIRTPYQGANPISDVWAARALEMAAQSIVRVVDDPGDDEARSHMILASCLAGIGFGNAGVHLPHGMSYPVAGMVRSYVPDGYRSDHAIVPHGMAVLLNAPAVFRFTAQANPERHLLAARLMGADTRGAAPEDGGELLAGRLVALMRRTGMPNGLSAVGYGPGDVPKLVEGTLPQHRVTKLCPRPFTEGELAQLFLDSMRCW